MALQPYRRTQIVGSGAASGLGSGAARVETVHEAQDALRELLGMLDRQHVTRIGDHIDFDPGDIATCSLCCALRVVDGWGVDVPDGKATDFRRAVQAKDGETVVFGWIEWPDKPTRDAGMGALMQDPRMRETPPPWNGPLAIFGGFTPILDTSHA